MKPAIPLEGQKISKDKATHDGTHKENGQSSAASRGGGSTLGASGLRNGGKVSIRGFFGREGGLKKEHPLCSPERLLIE